MAQLGSDSFTGNPGDALPTYNPAWVSVQGLTGVMVISPDGDKTNLSGATATASYYRSDIVPPTDYSVSIDITYTSLVVSGPAVGVVLYVQPAVASTCYEGRILSNGSGRGVWQVRRFSNGSGTTLSSADATIVSGATDNLRLERSGTALKLYVNNNPTPVVSISDATLTDPGRAGIRNFNGSSSRYQMDNFSVDTPGAATQPGNATVDGVSSNPAAGLVFASGSASAALSGVRANPAAGSVTASGSASAFIIGVAASPAASSLAASGASSAQVVGVSAAPDVGTPLASGRVSAEISGVAANPAAGAISAGSAGMAVISGAAAKPSAADLVASGASNAIIVGVVANPAAGLVTAEIEAGQEDDIDALLVPPRQTVVFEGSIRVVAFEGSKRVVSFEGSKRLVEFQ